MKLWQKIFLYTLMLVMLAVGVTSILMLRSSFQLTVEQKRQAAYTEHEFLISNFRSMLLSERLRKDAILLEESKVQEYMENTFGEEEGISFFNGNQELVYQNQEMESQKELIEIVAKTGESHMQIIGEALYIASKESLETNTYYFMTKTDLGDVLAMYRDMLSSMRINSMVCAVVIAAFLLAVVKLLLLPLQKINEGTRAIAQGDYQLRVPQRGRDEISELAWNMNRMAESVEKNIQALEDVAEDRNQFIANLSHEMKTPLTSILGFSDLLQIKSDLPEEKRLEYVGIIKEEAGRMRTLSGKLMEMITVGAANVEWKEEEVSEIFGEIGTSLAVVAQSHEMRLSLECEKGTLWMDKELVKSLVYNLADNAMKASKAGDEIVIRGWFEEEVFFFSVSDSGIGIPREEIAKITQAFYMVDKVRSRARGGAGLGLALCVEIAKLHRGNLSIESRPKEGTVVTVRMKGGAGNEAYEDV
ncbi:MAG: HAMP domain-containing histidine kinase [Lachnospiraceae bacterium]|jgi:signal transduction histidine kinase|nr:HAMP domain-containing histidine kinase [Lachnospiraceae bacterium]